MSATGRGRKRISQDSYPTPEWCITGLRNQLEDLTAPLVLDPACGDGRILKGLGAKNGREFDILTGTDYLTWKPRYRKPINLLVTNPPYNLAEQFIRKALEQDNVRALCLLLRVNFLGSGKRFNLFQLHMPRQLMILTLRPCFVWVCRNKQCKSYYPVGYKGPCDDCGGAVTAGSDASEYAWFWWGETRLLRSTTSFVWINRKEF